MPIKVIAHRDKFLKCIFYSAQHEIFIGKFEYNIFGVVVVVVLQATRRQSNTNSIDGQIILLLLFLAIVLRKGIPEKTGKHKDRKKERKK